MQEIGHFGNSYRTQLLLLRILQRPVLRANTAWENPRSKEALATSAAECSCGRQRGSVTADIA